MKDPAIDKSGPLTIVLDLNSTELPRTRRPFCWKGLRQTTCRLVSAYSHRYVGLWKPCAVQLDVPRAWSEGLDQGQAREQLELERLTRWLTAAGLAYRIGVTATREHPRLTIF